MSVLLSVVVPAYNEEQVLPLFVERLRPALDSLGDPYEVVVVDDGSTDLTPALLLGLRRTWPELRVVRLRMNPERRHSNLLDAVHGGVTLALIDISLFAGMRVLTGGDAAGSVTLDLSTQFIGAGKVGQPLDAVVEILRETGRLMFLRGIVEQDGAMVAAYNGTIRKPSVKR